MLERKIYNEMSDDEKIKAAKDCKNILTFCDVILDKNLYWYQKNMIRDNSSRKLYRTGRRVGVSLLIELESLYEAISKPSTEIIIITPHKVQVKTLYTHLMKIIEDTILKKMIKPGLNNSFKNIKFDNNSSITIVSAEKEKESLLGFSPDVVLIEIASHINEKAMKNIKDIFSSSSFKGKLILAGTPTSKKNYFYEACKDLDKWSHHHYPSYVNPLWENISEKIKNTMSKQEYKLEIEAEFLK